MPQPQPQPQPTLNAKHSPNPNPNPNPKQVVTWCALNNIVIIPGCQTPSEAYEAYRAGAPVQKIFPGVAGGAAWVKVSEP